MMPNNVDKTKAVVVEVDEENEVTLEEFLRANPQKTTNYPLIYESMKEE